MITLNTKTREIPSKTLKTVRKRGEIPAELYGKKQKNQHLFVDEVVLNKVIVAAGESSLINLAIDNSQPIKVLIHDIQKDPVTDKVNHVDFYQVDMKRAITIKIPLVFIGESKAVKELEGTLVKNIDEIEINCLPDDLINQIEVDISTLKTFDDVIRIKDLNIPKAIKPESDLDNVVASVVPHYVEKEVTAKPETETAPEETKEAETTEGKTEKTNTSAAKGK